VNVYCNDMQIENNTAEGIVKIVFPHSIDMDIVDITNKY